MKWLRNTAAIVWILIFFLASSGITLISHSCHRCGCSDFHLFIKPYCCGNEKCHDHESEACDSHSSESQNSPNCCSYQYSLIKIKSHYTVSERPCVTPEFIAAPEVTYHVVAHEEEYQKVQESISDPPPLLFSGGKTFIIYSNTLKIPHSC